MKMKFDNMLPQEIVRLIEYTQWLEIIREVAVDIAKVLPDKKDIEDILGDFNNSQYKIEKSIEIKENLQQTLQSHLTFLQCINSFEKIINVIDDGEIPLREELSAQQQVIMDDFYETLELSGFKTKYKYVKDVREHIEYRINSINIAINYIEENIKKLTSPTIH